MHVWSFLRGLGETSDPLMDALTAGNAHHIYSPQVERRFEASWRPVPLLGHLLPKLGLPGVLTAILCFASACQVYKPLGQLLE